MAQALQDAPSSASRDWVKEEKDPSSCWVASSSWLLWAEWAATDYVCRHSYVGI